MPKILVFTDIHITEPGQTIIGLDPLQRFTDALAHALHRHPDADRIVITGDLVHSAKPAEYARFRAALTDCALPISMTLGNHDRRAPFRAHFPDVPLSEDGFVQEIIDLPGWRLILADTLDEAAEPDHSGLLCEARLTWIEAALRDSGTRRAVLFTHHPTFTTGFRGMDNIGLRNRGEVGQRLARFPQLVQIVSGHVHRTIAGATGTIPSVVFKSPCHQMPMNMSATGSYHSVDEPGAYGILLLDDEGVVALSEDYALATGESGRY